MVRTSLAKLTVAVMVGALALAGCGDDDDDSGQAPATTEETATTEATGTEASTLDVEARDYAFAVTGKATTGLTSVRFTNTGKELHMMEFIKLKAGKTLADALPAFQSQDEQAGAAVFDDVEVKGVTGLLGAGEAYETTAEAFPSAGTYVLACFIPTEGEGMPHVAKGMISTVEVAEGTAAERPRPDATYTIGAGTIDGPKELKAGDAVLEVTGGAGGPHEFDVIRSKSSALTFEEADKYFKETYEPAFAPGGPPPPKGAYANAPFEISGTAFDISDATIFMKVKLEPGTYTIGCGKEPEEGESFPTHREFVTVTVT